MIIENDFRKKTLTYFFRKKGIDFSIERVFNSIIPKITLHINTKSITVPYNKVNFYLIIKNLFFCRKYKSEINHITGVIHYCSLALPYTKTIITIHDMISVETGRGFKKFFFWFFFFYLPIKRCKYVTCISESVRDSLIKYKCCPLSKIIIIPNPVSDSYIYTPKSFNKANPRILHIGTRPNKNLVRVIQALHNISCQLVIIGELTNSVQTLLKQFRINYINKNRLSDDEIFNEYLECDIVSFPSVFEGFGLPIIEGQAVGRPVLTSNILPMKQIAGENYYLINPFNVEDLKVGFLTLINNDLLRKNMIEIGLKNVLNYRSDSIASQYLNLYMKILNS